MSLGLQGGSHLSHGHVLVFPYELRVRLTTTLYNMRVVCDGWRSLPKLNIFEPFTMDQFIIASLSHTHYWYVPGFARSLYNMHGSLYHLSHGHVLYSRTSCVFA